MVAMRGYSDLVLSVFVCTAPWFGDVLNDFVSDKIVQEGAESLEYQCINGDDDQYTYSIINRSGKTSIPYCLPTGDNEQALGDTISHLSAWPQPWALIEIIHWLHADLLMPMGIWYRILYIFQIYHLQ